MSEDGTGQFACALTCEIQAQRDAEEREAEADDGEIVPRSFQRLAVADEEPSPSVGHENDGRANQSQHNGRDNGGRPGDAPRTVNVTRTNGCADERDRSDTN